MKKIFKILHVLLLCTCSLSVWAGIEHVVKETEGRAASLSVAINNALLDAIAQVNGKTLEGNAVMASLETSMTDGQDTDYFASDSYANLIKEKTKGAIRSYTLLSKEQRDGLWEVKVRAEIAKYKAEKGSKRKSIAIMPVRLLDQSYLLGNNKLSAERVSKAINQGVTNALTQTRKFTVLDREYMEDSANIKAEISRGETPIEDMARLGQKLAADYMLVGTINNLRYVNAEKTSKASGRTYYQTDGRTVLDFRLINVATQQAVVSNTVISKYSASKTSASSLLSGLSSDLGKKISKIIHDQIYPMLIVSASSDQLVIGQGGNGIRVGDHYKVYKYGEKIYDPYTKEFMGRSEKYVGKIKITRVNPKQSYGTVIESAEDLAANFAPRKYILREKIQPKMADVSKKIKAKREERKSKRSSDDEW
jgi:curli biogenesis system outer membrane secretion channel CsgG